MPQVSKRLVSQKTLDKIQKLFLSALTKASSPTLTSELIADLLTPTEQIMLAKRFAIAYMLEEKYDYRTIASIIKVSTTTIGMVAITLKHRGNGLRQILKKIKKDEALEEVFTSLKGTFAELIASAPGQNWSESKRILYRSRYNRQKPF